MKRKVKKNTPYGELKKYIRSKKTVTTIYLVLRLLVILTMISQILSGNFQNVLVCILTLFLFMLPSIIERRFHIVLPSVLEIIILLFIFAADILGEIQEFYILIPHWDTVLHTINGFLFAAIGFCILNIFNSNKRITFTLSPFSMALVAFSFSMTIGVLWEFYEWGMDRLFGFDMQKDVVLQSIASVAIHPDGRNVPIAVTDIKDMILVFSDGTQQVLGLGGYLDIGLQDTMKDLLVNMLGAVLFSFIGYFYVKTLGRGKIAKMFIPEVLDEPSNTIAHANLEDADVTSKSD